MSELYQNTHQGGDTATSHDKPGWPSGRPAREVEGPVGASSRATGSLPVSSAEALCRELEKEAGEADALSSAQIDGYTCGWNDGMSAGLDLAAKRLRRIAGLPSVRQPEENVKAQTRSTK